MKKENLIQAIEALTEQIEILNQRLAPCDFTGWTLSETVSNLAAVLEEQKKQNQEHEN